MAHIGTIYMSYLLRAWCEVRDGQTVWRASLEQVQTGERHMFADVDDLFRFLRRQMELPPVPESGRD